MMGEDQKNVDTCRKKMRRRILPIWTCLNLITIFLLANSMVLAQTTIRYNEFTYETLKVEFEVTEDPALQLTSNEDVSSPSPFEITSENDGSLLSSTEKANNAVPDTLPENIKKRVMKKIEPMEKNKPSLIEKIGSPAGNIVKEIRESEGLRQPEFVPLNDTTRLKKSEFEATTETQDETELDISTIDYGSSDFSGVMSSDSDAVTNNENNLPSKFSSNSNSSTVNLTSSTNEYQVRKISTLQKDFYSEESTVASNTFSINQNQSSNSPMKNIQNNNSQSENNTVTYKVSTDKFESLPNMLTFITTTTPATTVPVLPKTKSIIEDSTMNSSEKSVFESSDTFSEKRQLKTTTPEETLTSTINDNKNQLTTVATVTATDTTSSKLLNSKMLTIPESMTTVTNTTTNASIETHQTSIETTKTNELLSKETTITTMSTSTEKTQAIINTTTGSTLEPSTVVEKSQIRTSIATTTAASTTTTELVETVPIPTTVPTTVMILTPIITVTTTTVNKITPPSTKTTPSVVTISKTQSSDSTWPVEKATETSPATNVIPPRISTDSITIFVQLVIKGTWEDICSKLSLLKRLLAELINKNMNNKSSKQIFIHQSRCFVSSTPTSLVLKNPLTSVLVYVVNENGSYNETLTRLLPELYNKEPIDFTPTIQSVKLIEETDSGNSIVVILVASVTFVCIVLLAGLVFIMKKRQSRFNYGERCRPVSLDAYSLDSVSAYNSIRRNKAVLRSSKRSYGNPSFEDSSSMPTHALNFARLTTFCNESNAIVEEFGTIPQISSKIDELPVGAELKNRYANVIPLPETRVYLQSINNDPTTEYINASYVRGPKNAEKFYIASQAPTENTVSDFWRMIWEQQCKVIIMLTDLVENGVEKCTEYVPPLEVSDCHRLYGDYQVTLKKREAKDKYAISTLLLKNLEKNVYREVWHVWYLWPTKGVPNDPAGLVSVLLEARALQRGSTAPILMHCSPGTGRTGTVIAIDLLIRQYEITRTVDVPRIVYSIRRDRAGAVQTREQYSFIYKALSFYADKLTGGAIEST